MVVVGTDFVGFSHVVTQSTGTSIADGWVRVCEIADGDWNPPAGAGSPNEIVNVFWATIGDLFIGSNTNPHAAVQLCFGTHTQPWPWYGASVRLDPRLGDRAGVPCFFVMPNVAAPLGAWPANARPAIWARVWTGGGPLSGTLAQVTITNATILSFYRAQLNALHFVQRQQWTGVLPRPGTNGSLVHTFSPSAAELGSSSRYLGFFGVRYTTHDDGTGPFRVPAWELAWNDASAGTKTNLLGRRWGATTMPDRLRFGISHFGAPAAYGEPTNIFSIGGFFEVWDLGAGDTFDVRLWWHGGNVNLTFEIHDVTLFLIEDSNLGSLHGSLRDLVSGFPVHNDHDVSVVSFEPMEFLSANIGDPVVIACAKYYSDGATSRTPISHQMRVRHNGGTARGRDVYALTKVGVEGVHTHVADRFRLPASAARVEAYAIQNPREAGQALTRLTDDFFVAAWSWENDPNFIPISTPVVPPATWLVPSRESLGLGSLLALPIEPDQAQQDQIELPRHRFDPDDGVAITWPKYLTVRRAWSLQWSNLSLSDRDTLQAFFDVNRTFKWTPPGETAAVALTLVEPANATDVGSRHASVATRAVQLVWSGP